jgi:hypothetical protein
MDALHEGREEEPRVLDAHAIYHSPVDYRSFPKRERVN